MEDIPNTEENKKRGRPRKEKPPIVKRPRGRPRVEKPPKEPGKRGRKALPIQEHVNYKKLKAKRVSKERLEYLERIEKEYLSLKQ